MVSVLRIFGIVFIALIAIFIIGGFLVYNFFSVHVASVCVYSDRPGMITNFACSSNIECKNDFYQNSGNASNLPDPLKDKIDVILDDVALCSHNLCEFKEFAIIKNTGLIKDQFEGEIELVDSCDGISVSVRLKLKEVLDIAKSMRNN